MAIFQYCQPAARPAQEANRNRIPENARGADLRDAACLPGIFANTVNPGGVATGLQRDFTQQQKDSLAAAEAAGTFTYETLQQGAANTLIAAIAPELAHTGGHYLDDGIEAYTVPNDASLSDHPHGVKEWALDPEIAKRLWLVSLDLPWAIRRRRGAEHLICGPRRRLKGAAASAAPCSVTGCSAALCAVHRCC
jgi:hypothetical protein